MYKKIQLLAFLFLYLNSFSQDLVSSIPIELKSNRDVFQIVNDSTNEVTLFLSDRKKVSAFFLGENLNLKDSVSNSRPERKFKDILGYAGTQQEPTLYWSTSNNEEICSQIFKKGSNKDVNVKHELKLEAKGEKYLQSFSEKGNFYILTVVKYKSFLKLYCFDRENNLKETKIDTKDFKLYKSKNEFGIISQLFETMIGDFIPFEDSFSLTKISIESPTSLTESAKKRKCYSNAEQIILTFDFNDTVTQLLIIDLLTLRPSFIEISKPVFQNVSVQDVNSNSFLFTDKLYQISLISSEISLTIKDLKGNLLKVFSANEKEPFNFKNTGFLRQNPFGSERELETTAQFLRKVVRSNVGVSCYELNGKYSLTFGSVSPKKGNGGGISTMGMGGFGTGMGMGAGMAVAPIFFTSISYTANNFNSYTSRRVIYTQSLIDKDLNHTDDKINEIAFDKIKSYTEEYSSDLNSTTIFKLKNHYYLGNYNSLNRYYNFRSFVD